MTHLLPRNPRQILISSKHDISIKICIKNDRYEGLDGLKIEWSRKLISEKN